MGLSDIKPIEILIIVGVLVLLFGSKKLPDTARGLGRSLRIFKSELKATDSDDDTTEAAAPQQITVTRETTQAQTQPVPPAQPATGRAETPEETMARLQAESEQPTER
jgi:sec-independent protein translocase protein TatA